MDSKTKSSTIITKDLIGTLYFPSDEVLDDPDVRTLRQIDIMRAMRLGNRERYKVKIIFEDSESIKAVLTTIWAVAESKVVLKSGVVIPVHRIHGVEFF